jgi:hypothetical protein
MTTYGTGFQARSVAAAAGKSMPCRLHPLLLALVAAVAVVLAVPTAASAHGPVDPIASSYLARIGSVPPGLEAKAVDGDQRMWLEVRRGIAVVVLDYRGAPYLRFSPAGVFVNRNSAMYYLNQAPVALAPPASLGPSTPPHWQRVSWDSSYIWHDGRLHALASVAIAPGAAFVGRWRVPIILDGRRTAITGGLWHASNPPLVWFWPIFVLLACVVAAWRLHRPALDRRLARGLGIAALIALSVAVSGRELHGRPSVSVFQTVELVAVLAFAAWALHRLLFVRHGYFTYFVIAVVALWQGAMLIPTLFYGFVLASEPAFLARAASVLCLGAGISLLLMVFRLAEERDTSPAFDPLGSELETEDDSAWELA